MQTRQESNRMGQHRAELKLDGTGRKSRTQIEWNRTKEQNSS